VRAERFAWRPGLAAELRALVPGGASVATHVEQIVAAVRAGGDAALRDFVARFDGYEGPLRVEPGAPPEGALRAGLEVAIANVRAVAEAGVGADELVELPQGHSVLLRELPVRRAAIYVPGGRAPYPSTVVMGAVTAQAAGVEEVVVCAPGAHPVILAACALCGVDEVYAMGGAHAVAALAYGTETIERVDVIAGPGNLYVQEAKRQCSADVGIDGFAGPSDVLVVAAGWTEVSVTAVQVDLAAQAEHGPGTIVVAASDEPALLDAIDFDPGEAVCALVDLPDMEAGLELANDFAPEHLELIGAAAEALAPRVRSAGCVFVGASGATAFGDYVAGSNHCLPTGGAARFASGLGARHFRRRMSEVRIGDAAKALAQAGVPIAEAEGFGVHARSMRERENARP
jgi:histidinol dehydrogenase